jgi:competence protein ComEC
MEIAIWNERDPILDAKLDSEIAFEGVVEREPDVRENVTQLYVESGGEIVLVMADPDIEVSYGDTVVVEGLLQEPASFETDLGRTFNYKGYLQARGVAYVVAFADVKKTGEGGKNPVIALLLSFKQSFMEKIEKAIPQPQAGLSEGLLLGVKQALGEDLEAAFRKTGIMHIVVLSGYNIMLVILFVMYVLSYLLPFKARIWFGLIAIVLFAAMVGFSATVVRASIMAALVLIAKQIGRTYTVIRSLLITGIVMVLINPYLLGFDVGFQLSFIATLGLILLAPCIEKYVKFMPTTIGLREFLTATIATQIFVTPMLLYHIGEFSVVSVLVNMLVLPMVPVAMLLTFAAGMAGFVSEAASIPIGYLAYLSLLYITWIAQFFAQLPFASFVVPAFPFAYVFLAYIPLAWVLWKARASQKLKDPLSGWTIVDEETLVPVSVPPSAASSATPVFFR